VTLYFTDTNTGALTVVASERTGYDNSSSHFVFPFTKLKGDTYTIIATYASAHYSSPPPNPLFYDPSGTRMGFPTSQISLPYNNSGDSTGHSVHLYMYF
jgi:hypothetical protein